MEKLSEWQKAKTSELLRLIADPINTREGVWRMAYRVLKDRLPGKIGDDQQAIRYARTQLGLPLEKTYGQSGKDKKRENENKKSAHQAAS